MSTPKILVACEESQPVTIELRRLLVQIRDALYEISDTLKEVKETEDTVNKCENCPYKTYYEQGYVWSQKRQKI